ncbi:Crp/Fnr family transcriptional regulator [Flavobacterium sp.]|jgi:CRP-like cAMP-binding protein|uniref:Crp/Fnr family transcriptional regulator n=1 Tax=Flavobacterium sp. TaxID=239 RepID=UPI0037BF1712
MNPFVTFLKHYIDLTSMEIESIENTLEKKSFKAGEIVLKEKSICKHITFLVYGKARSYFINHEGQEFTWSLHFNDKDSKFENYFLLDYNSFLSKSPTHLTIEVIEDIEVIMLSYENLQNFMATSLKIATLNNRMSEIAYQNVHNRAFSLLTLTAKERYLQLLKEEPYLLNKFKHYLIASYLGIAPQSLSRLRNEIVKS